MSRAGKYPPPKHVDPRAMMREESESDEEEEDEEFEEEFDLVEAMNDLPIAQRRRVYALKGLLSDYRALRRNFIAEMSALELKSMAEDRARWEQRRLIVSGERDVTAEELAAATDKTESKVEEIPSDEEEAAAADDKKKPAAKKSAKVVTPGEETAAAAVAAAGDSEAGGIPGFWLTAIKNNEVLEGMVQDRDEEALRALTNIDVAYVDENPRKGFVLTFHFAPNPYFTNATLTKTYLMVDDETTADDEDGTLDKALGTDIEWTAADKKLTVVIKQKKQRHKSGKGVRIVQREEKVPSFFHFFTAPVEPADDDDENENEDDEEIPYDEQLEMDYEAGLAFAQGLVPRAVHYFSGKAVDDIAAGLQVQFGFGGAGDDEEDEDDDDDDEEEEEQMPPPRRGGGGGAGGRPQQQQQQQPPQQRGGGGGGGGAAKPPGKAAGGKAAPECKQQ